MPSLAASPPPALLRNREAIERGLREAIGEEASPLAASARYVLGWEDEEGMPAAATGKRIRPALCLLAAEIFGGKAEEALPGAVAVELVHNFSLVHDEVQDRDAERHGRPTLWARLGEAQAINAGDFLYTRAIRALTGASGEAAVRLAALSVLEDAVARMIAGQWDDISFESRSDVSVDEYQAMVAGKTGALLGAPLEIGALLAGAAGADAALLGRWGVQVGLAFQAQDDYLGTWGDRGETGKSNTNDVARRKKSWPVVYGLAQPRSRPVLEAVFSRPGEPQPGDVARAIEALETVGAAEACREQARRYAAAADALLAELPLRDDDRSLLGSVAAYIADRRA